MSDPIWNEQSYERKTSDSILTARWFTILLAALSGIIGIIILYYLFYPSHQSNEKHYVIEMGNKPFKEKPEKPGGIRFPHQDKMVYENLLGNTSEEKNDEEVVFTSNQESPLEIIQTPLQERPAPSSENHPPLTVEEITPVIEKVIIEQPVVIKESSVPSRKKDSTKTTKETDDISTTLYRVQLAALPDKKRLEGEWRKIRRAHKSLLAGQKMSIESTSIPKKGTFYRLQIGSFKNRHEAVTLCDKIKNQKGTCFVPK